VMDEGSGRAVLCLHGFPQNAKAFDNVAELLVAAGFRVIRFNQRGYTDGEIKGRRTYSVARIAADAVDVLDELGVKSCIVVGHDLGGVVAWEIGRTFPSRVDSLVIAGVPHPGAFLVSLLGLRQIARSWHFIVSQSTRLTTLLYSPKREASRVRFATSLAERGLPLSDSAQYLDYLAVGNRFVGAIRWYQAMPFSSPKSAFFISRKPVEILWGDRDAFTGGLSIRLSQLFVPAKRLRITALNGGTHWLVDQNAQDIVQAVVRVP
jgi:pimeloyl-ACP methyl ester carboxylesterase